MIELQLYYFGEDNVTIRVYRNQSLNQLITTFAGVNSGDLLVIDGTVTPNGQLGTRTYLEVTTLSGDVCVTDIYTRCPTNAWPGALDDLNILGKTYGDFVVYARTDSGNNYVCTIADADQDWHVGGNVVDAPVNTMGTRNNENVVFITNDAPRGTITSGGQFGINTQAPAAQLDVQGDVLIDETLDVNGITTIHNTTSSTTAADGALIVAGGAGIGENLNVGQNADVGVDLTVGQDGFIGRNLDVTQDAAVGNNLSVGVDATIGNDLTVTRDAAIGRNLDVVEDASVGDDLTVVNDAAIGNDATIGNDLTVTRDAAIGDDLSVTNNGTIGTDLSVGNDAMIGRDAAISRNLNVSQNTTIGNDLDVGGDAHLDGVVTIGTNNTPGSLGTVSTSGYHLFVDGGILTEEVLVRTGWADYVFDENYELKSLEEVEQHIAEKGHLPNTPSAQEIEEGGLPLGEAAVNQQEKIEELFLYLIEMNKEIQQLKAENAALRAELKR